MSEFVTDELAPLRSTSHIIYILNQRDPGSALVHNSFVSQLYDEKFLLDASFESNCVHIR